MTSSQKTSGNGRRHSRNREAQPVDTNVVVFPEFPRRLKIAMRSLGRGARAPGDDPVTIDEVRLVPQLPLPLRGLLEQMMPRDRVIVRCVEAAVFDRSANLLMRIANQSAIPCETGENRKITLCNAEGHVRPLRIAPFGDDLA